MSTALEVVKEEAAKYGLNLDDKEADYVAREHTGYPSFWPDGTKTPEENMRQQVREWAEVESKKRKAKR